MTPMLATTYVFTYKISQNRFTFTVWPNRNTNTNNLSLITFKYSRPPHSYNGSASIEMDLWMICYRTRHPVCDQIMPIPMLVQPYGSLRNFYLSKPKAIVCNETLCHFTLYVEIFANVYKDIVNKVALPIQDWANIYILVLCHIS